MRSPSSARRRLAPRGALPVGRCSSPGGFCSLSRDRHRVRVSSSSVHAQYAVGEQGGHRELAKRQHDLLHGCRQDKHNQRGTPIRGRLTLPPMRVRVLGHAGRDANIAAGLHKASGVVCRVSFDGHAQACGEPVNDRFAARTRATVHGRAPPATRLPFPSAAFCIAAHHTV
jgi:hypothetical protein